jgi:hypothetical protein
MNSLSELNNYSNEIITYEDERDATVIFDRAIANDQSITTTENSTFNVPLGIQIQEIIDYAVTLPYIEIDFTNYEGSIDLVFPTLPGYITVTESPANFWTISGLIATADWDLIKTVLVQPTFGFVGTETFDVAIKWFSADGITLNTQSYTVTSIIIDTVYITSGTDYNWIPRTTFTISGTPNIIAELGATNPDFTLVMTPSQTLPISLISSSGGSAVSRDFNPTTKVYTLVGSKVNLNLELDNLSIQFSEYSEEFFITYNLSNNLNDIEEIQLQYFNNSELVSLMEVAGSQLTFALSIQFGVASLQTVSSLSASATAGTAYVRWNNYSPVDQSQTLIENVDTTTNNAVSLLAFTNSALANVRIEFDLSGCDSGTIAIFDQLPAGVTLTSNDRNYLISGIDTIEKYNASKDVQLNLPTNTYQTQTYTYNIYYDDPTGNDKVISYNVTLNIDVFLLNRDTTRTFYSNQGNTIFSSLALLINEYQTSPYSNLEDLYKLTLTVSGGNLLDQSTRSYSSPLVISGTGNYLNSIVPSLKYYSPQDTTSDFNINIKLEFKSVGAAANVLYNTIISSYNIPLNYISEGSISPQIYTLNTTAEISTFNTFDLGFYLYNGVMDYVLVGGGGGGSASVYNNGAKAWGGGGAGGIVVYQTSVDITTASYSYTVGNGSAGNNSGPGGSGNPSTFNGLSAAGGGGAILGGDTGNDPTPDGGSNISFSGGTGRLSDSVGVQVGGGGAGAGGNGGPGQFNGTGGTPGAGVIVNITSNNAVNYGRGGRGAGRLTLPVAYTTPGSGGVGWSPSGSTDTDGKDGIIIVKMYF